MTHVKDLFPSYTRLERFADACVHAASLAFSVVATAILLGAAIGTVPPADVAGLTVYCLGLLSMFGASAAYNLVSRHRLELKEFLRRLDHAAIFVMIAGSYTPFALTIGGSAGFWMLIAVWGIAAVGITVKLCFPRRFEKLSVLLYLAQGWIVLLALGPVASALPSQALWLLLAGGVVYTLGVPFHLMEWMRFHNVIWHAFVLGGAACQFVAIQAAVLQAA
jgi:hemolysin III